MIIQDNTIKGGLVLLWVSVGILGLLFSPTQQGAGRCVLTRPNFPQQPGCCHSPSPPRILHTSLAMHFFLALLFINKPGPTPHCFSAFLLQTATKRELSCGCLHHSGGCWRYLLNCWASYLLCDLAQSFSCKHNTVIKLFTRSSFIIQKVHKAEA